MLSQRIKAVSLVAGVFAIAGGALLYQQRYLRADTLQQSNATALYGTYELSLSNTSRRPIEGVTVFLSNQSTTESATTNSRGQVRFPRLTPGIYAVSLFDPTDNELQVGDTELQARIEARKISKDSYSAINYPPNLLPRLRLDLPRATEKVSPDTIYTVSYQFTDTDDPTLTAQLFYRAKSDRSGGLKALNGSCQKITQNSQGTCQWNTKGLRPDSYTLIAQASDDINLPITTEAPGTLLIVAAPPRLHSISFITPSVTQGQNARLQYSLFDDTLSDTTVTFATDEVGKKRLAGSCSTAGLGDLKVCTWDTSNVPAGRYRVYGITNQQGQQEPFVRAPSANEVTIGPARPDGLKGSSKQRGMIILEWDDNATGEDGYEIFRATARTGEYQRIGTTKETTFGDTRSLESGKKYYYKVRASKTLTPNNLSSEFSEIEEVKAK